MSRRRGVSGGSLRRSAQSRLRFFRHSSLLAVAFTGLLLLLLVPDQLTLSGATLQPQAQTGSEVETGDSVASPDGIQPTPGAQDTTPDSLLSASDQARQATDEATGALRGLWEEVRRNFPKYLIAAGVLAFAAVAVRLLRGILRRLLARYERADAFTALSGIAIYLVAIGVAISVLVGDIRALAGSLGLLGLALSWALQTPIESFTGWILNSFKGYYRVGDRIAVADIYGDVYRIDFLNTTVWEIGGRDHPPGWIQAEQPTGRLITFPNNEVLSGSVINYTRDFPFVWDELTISVANESDLPYAMEVLREVTNTLLGDSMSEPARRYKELLYREGLVSDVAEMPEVYAALTDWGANLTIRYLVDARQKRKWKSELVIRANRAMNAPVHRGKILPVYPRQQIQLVHPDGSPADPGTPYFRNPAPDGSDPARNGDAS